MTVLLASLLADNQSVQRDVGGQYVGSDWSYGSLTTRPIDLPRWGTLNLKHPWIAAAG